MSWVVESDLTWFQKFCINVLKIGPVPQHLAVIMDGNRRFAKKNLVEGKYGHVKGFEKLAETLQWCLELGITEVTVYAFSIENFKRSSDEVHTLMQLAKEKFQDLIKEKDKLMSEGVRIRILGNLSLLPADVRKLLAEAMLMTKDNDKLFLNVAFAYTAQEEIVHSISTVVNGVHSGNIEKEDIDKILLSRCLYTNKVQEPDLLIRTSGETRFSDFMLWQINYSPVCFTKVLWPDFCIWHLLASVFAYQRSFMTDKHRSITFQCLNQSQQKFLEHVESSQWSVLEEYIL